MHLASTPHWRGDAHLGVLGLKYISLLTLLIVVGHTSFADFPRLCRMLAGDRFLFIAKATATQASLDIGPAQPPIGMSPLRRWDVIALKALRFAIGFTPDGIAVQGFTEECEKDNLSDRWAHLVEKPATRMGIHSPELVVLRSEYRLVRRLSRQRESQT